MDQPFVGNNEAGPPRPPAARININDYLTETPVNPVKVSLRCPSCLKGRLAFTGMQNQTLKATLYQHKCECGFEMAVTGTHFPRIEFKEAAMPEEPIGKIGE